MKINLIFFLLDAGFLVGGAVRWGDEA